MNFEYDPDKSAANLDKHSIAFDEAQALWRDPRRIEIPARTADEPRFLIVGKIGVKHWSAVVTSRNDSIRLISVRRARKEAMAIYESG